MDSLSKIGEMLRLDIRLNDKKWTLRIQYWLRKIKTILLVYSRAKNKERPILKILEWCLPGKRRKGRHWNPWTQKVTTKIREREELTTWNGWTGKNEELKRYLKTLGTEDEGTHILNINKINKCVAYNSKWATAFNQTYRQMEILRNNVISNTHRQIY